MNLPDYGPDAEFQNRVSDGHLWLQKCDACGAFVFHPRLLCNHCGSLDLTWQRASGKGRIHSATTIRRRPRPGSEQPEFHSLILVDLDEGPRLMSHMKTLPAEALPMGTKVQARIAGEPGEFHVLFDLSEAGQ